MTQATSFDLSYNQLSGAYVVVVTCVPGCLDCSCRGDGGK